MTAPKSIPKALLFLLVLTGFACQVQANLCGLNPKFDAIDCVNINTYDDALLAKQYLANNMQIGVISLSNSNVDVLPDDFFSANCTHYLHFLNCTMTELPYRLTNPINQSLQLLDMWNSTIISSHPPGGGFSHYPRLETLIIRSSSIRIPSRAFVKLSNLKKLHFGFNTELQLEDKDVFQGQTKLQELYMNFNNLTVLPDGLFDPFGDSLSHLDLSGNPFHCTCEMQWLQDWIEKKGPEFKYEVSCKTPIEGDLATLKFCTKAIEKTPQPPTAEGNCTDAPLLEKLLAQALVTLRQDCPNLNQA